MKRALSLAIRMSWQQKSLLSWLLLPLSWAFRLITLIRRSIQKYKQKKSKCPVAVIGNISVGGNGKTSMVIALTKRLQAEGIKVGIVSKGYGRRYRYTQIMVNHRMSPDIIGDENALIWEKTGALIAVGPRRVLSVKQLENEGCDIILTDDGMQDYQLYRDIEIVMTSEEGLGNQRLIPAGPLREPLKRIQQANYHVMHVLDHDKECPETCVKMCYQPVRLRSLQNGKTMEIRESKDQKQSIYAMCGIGNPSTFFNMMEKAGFDVEAIMLPDHACISEKDCEKSMGKPICITEKDAIKLSKDICEKFDLWVVEVEADMCGMFDTMVNEIISRYKAN